MAPSLGQGSHRLRARRTGTRRHGHLRGICDGAQRYLGVGLSYNSARLFEEYFIHCRPFRHNAIFEIGTFDIDTEMRSASWPPFDPDREFADPDDPWYRELQRVYALFSFEDLTAEQLAEARLRYDRNVGTKPLPPVDLRTGDLLPVEVPVRQLTDLELARRYCHTATRGTAERTEIMRRHRTSGPELVRAVASILFAHRIIDIALSGGDPMPDAGRDAVGID